MNRSVLKILPAFAILLCVAIICFIVGNNASVEDTITDVPVSESITDIGELPTEYALSEDDLLTDDKDALPYNGGDIIDGGSYVLSGDHRQTIVIDAKDRIVHLILDNANIMPNDGPAIFVRSAAKVVLTAMEGTENTLADCAYHSDSELDAAIYSFSDFSVNGKGTVKITGFYGDGIYTDRVFRSDCAALRVKAKRDAVSADDGIVLTGEMFVAEAERNALKSDVHKRKSKGSIYILGGENDIVAGNTGIVGGLDLYVANCKLSLGCVVSDMEVEGNKYIEDGCL